MPFSVNAFVAFAACLSSIQGSRQITSTSNPDPFARYLYPLARPLPSPEVTIDVSDAPDLKPWAEQARKLVIDWFPHAAQLLATESYAPPKSIKLIFRNRINAPAYTSGHDITASASWVRRHPEDFGMIIHEMVHVIQAYPRGGDKPGWLVEGIADYIRWWRYEPESPRTRIDPAKASYRDSYRTTAAFLAWIVGKYDRTLVRNLDLALRSRSYSDEVFRKVTGRTVDELWAEYVSTLKPLVP